MDVEMQMEANGLPAHFSSTSEQPAENHAADDLAASISNSDAPISLPSKPAVTESAPQSAPESDQVFNASFHTLVPGILPEALPPSTNGINASAEQSISTVPDSQPQPSLETNSIPPSTSLTDSMTDSVVPSSIPAEIQSSATPAETQPTMMDIAEPVSVPPQPPESDLRTAPHSDALSPEAVAQVEAQKHQLDNSADIVPSPADANVMDISVAPDSANAIEQTPVTNLGLPSPPARSPSPAPAPQPAAASLPEHKLIPTTSASEPASEPASAPTLAPEPEPQQILVPQSESEAVLAAESDIEPIPAPEPETESIPSTEPRPQTPPTAAPAEEPKEPAPTSAVPTTQLGEDQEMIDVSHAKQPRPREDDDADSERAAKRVKTDESAAASQSAGFKVPEVPMAAPSPVANGGTPAATAPSDGDDTVTPARVAHFKKVISNLKKSNSSTPFRVPVDHVALNIPSYPDIVKQPMDLGTIDSRLKQNRYTSVAAFISDFSLIVNNCVTFNGPEHGITQQARKMESSFKSQMKNLPPATVEEPSKEIKKAAKKHEPTRQQAPRRPSVTTSSPAVATAPSPKSAAPQTPSFAPGPDGMPLIRRDSSFADGRPKRAIVPTKRNQEFGGGRPKKKKYELQLKFCDEVLKDIAHPKNWQMNQYFTHPVDPVALNIPTYFQIIKKPMDLATIRTKLTNNVYEKAKDFEEDVRLIFKNCYKFNPEGDLVNAAGRQLEDMFNKRWATKEEWIAAREPPSLPGSDAEDDDDEEDESEEEAEDSEDERAEKIRLLQKQIEEMSKQMGELTQKKVKKSKSPPTKKIKSKPSKKDKPAAPKEGKDKKEKKKSAPKAKPEKDRYVTFAEKQYISNGIGMLPEKQMSEALKIIQNSVPSLANTDQNEIELDIEEVPNHALLKLLNFVKKYAGPPPDEPKAEATENYSSATKSKKSKPMSKHDQEAQIEELKGKLGAYVGPVSPNAMPSIEGDSSDDDGDSEESEEE
ncbi:transcription initiation at TATA-containing promoter protein [Exophiala xenobiotica]|nr:transcription initiation at TATA-containing promoter protein [Exophiala xenobiotica]KAK5292919.1 transcription initiation at TATA-containing promoter protein [Exophiala xenobiotica]KAK5484521.1 transcription initiation at TATA-containing promoter protein [Exophiala xenobiotica]